MTKIDQIALNIAGIFLRVNVVDRFVQQFNRLRPFPLESVKLSERAVTPSERETRVAHEKTTARRRKLVKEFERFLLQRYGAL